MELKQTVGLWVFPVFIFQHFSFRPQGDIGIVGIVDIVGIVGIVALCLLHRFILNKITYSTNKSDHDTFQDAFLCSSISHLSSLEVDRWVGKNTWRS